MRTRKFNLNGVKLITTSSPSKASDTWASVDAEGLTKRWYSGTSLGWLSSVFSALASTGAGVLNRTILMPPVCLALAFLLIFNCKNESSGDGNGDATKYTLSITKPTGSTLTSDAGGINCGSKGTVCKAEFSKGAKVTLTAQADRGYAPGAWQGACDKTAADQACKLTMDANKTAGRAFLVTPILAINRPIGGSITNADKTIDCGSKTKTCEASFDKGAEVTLTAEVDTGYVLGVWGGDCPGDGNSKTCTLSMNANKTVSKVFSIIQRTFTIDRPTNGTLISKPQGIKCGKKGNNCITEFPHGTSVTLTAKPARDYDPGVWGGQACASVMDAGATCTVIMNTDKSADKAFTVSTADGDKDLEPNITDVDDDNDGLIDIYDLDMFNNIRHNLAGTSYKTDSSAPDDRTGAPEMATANCTGVVSGTSVYLCGYELMGDLDFDNEDSYDGIINDDWRPNNEDPDSAVNAGFNGIDRFNAVFEGNGYSISHLYSRGGSANVGLFRSTTGDTIIRNLGVVNARLYGSASNNEHIGSLVGLNEADITASYAVGGNLYGNAGSTDSVGGLVGRSQRTGSIITNCYATGVDLYGGAGDTDNVGGLVGSSSGKIIASQATGNVSGGDGDGDYVGSLVGFNFNHIIASYATGAANGGAGDIDHVGGLVGRSNSTIIASYATGAVHGGDGDRDYVGGLVGVSKKIIASYATGTTNGGAGNDDNVGGLVGTSQSSSSVEASFAMGNADGGSGTSGNYVGKLIGDDRNSATIAASYGFGSIANVGNTGADGDAHPAGLGSISDKAEKVNALTAPGGGADTDVDARWNDAGESTLNAWDFGTSNQPPALKYADYDGVGSGEDYCALFPTGTVCGTTLLPGQRP